MTPDIEKARAWGPGRGGKSIARAPPGTDAQRRIVAKAPTVTPHGLVRVGPRSSGLLAPPPALVQAPLPDSAVSPRDQSIGHLVTVPLEGAGVVRILRRASERRAEGLLHGALLVSQSP